eukprot:GEMP01068063.1.p1 GENE.GEMP01068063.1~~GEMP01068063.1.p1  ORF type:complete len:173 (+),score=43.46 GEMP01068063.1:33-551(+)
MDPWDPKKLLSPEEHEFLEDFGRKLARTVGISLLVGAGGANIVCRQLGIPRRKLCTFLGGFFVPMGAWYFMMSSNREEFKNVAVKIHAAVEQVRDEDRNRAPERALDEMAAVAKLFPPPPGGWIASKDPLAALQQQRLAEKEDLWRAPSSSTSRYKEHDPWGVPPDRPKDGF